MFRYKWTFYFLFILLSSIGWAQSVGPHRAPAQTFHERANFNIEFSFISWKEQLSLLGGGDSQKDYGDYFGNAVLVEYEHYWAPHWGTIAEFGFLTGLANLGGSQSHIPYQHSDVEWWGFKGSYRGAYRLSSAIATSIGPIFLYRKIDLPSSPGGVDVNSGESFNYGAAVDLRLLLNSHLEIRTEIGGLFEKASTLWSVGLGYKF